MRIILTGSSGRVGRAIFSALAARHDVVGIDRTPFSTTHIVGDFADEGLLSAALQGADAVIHTAALHAPHVGLASDREFGRVNVEGVRLVAKVAITSGVNRLVFTSTTALYGRAVSPASCTWIDEGTPPVPVNIYHRTKLEAERILEVLACPKLTVRVLRMSRSFPEPGDVMATYRLHRGVDVRDVAEAHVLAMGNSGGHFQRYVISGATPFARHDCEALARDAASVIRLRAPTLAAEFDRRGWSLPRSVDRIYDSAEAAQGLGWMPRFGFEEVFAQIDRRSLEVLPPGARLEAKPEQLAAAAQQQPGQRAPMPLCHRPGSRPDAT